MQAELEVTCAQVITAAQQQACPMAEGSTEDRELDAMLASVLGTGSGQPSAPDCPGSVHQLRSAAEAQHEQPPASEQACYGGSIQAFSIGGNR